MGSHSTEEAGEGRAVQLLCTDRTPGSSIGWGCRVAGLGWRTSCAGDTHSLPEGALPLETLFQGTFLQRASASPSPPVWEAAEKRSQTGRRQTELRLSPYSLPWDGRLDFFVFITPAGRAMARPRIFTSWRCLALVGREKGIMVLWYQLHGLWPPQDSYAGSHLQC